MILPPPDPAFDWLWVLIAGSKAQRVDVDQGRVHAAYWYQGGATLQELANQLVELTAGVENSIGGETAAAFRGYVQRLASTVPQLVTLAQRQGDSLLDLALNVEAAIYGMYIEVAFFAASIATALLSPFTAPLVPSLITAARTAVNQILHQLHWIVRVLVEALQEGVEEVIQGAIAQITQFLEGNRHDWDKTSTLIEFVAGSAAGGIIGGNHALAHKFKPELNNRAWFHGLNEAFAETIVGIGAAGILGQSMDDAWTGTVNGAFSGSLDKKVNDVGDAIDEVVNGPKFGAPDTSGFTPVPRPEVFGGPGGANKGTGGPGPEVPNLDGPGLDGPGLKGGGTNGGNGSSGDPSGVDVPTTGDDQTDPQLPPPLTNGPEGVGGPEDIRPGTPQPEITQPDVTQPDTTQPDVLPPGALPPGTLPPGTLPPGTLPPKASLPQNFAPGTQPPGDVPPGALPQGTQLPGNQLPGAQLPGTQPPGTPPTGIQPPSTQPPGNFAPGTQPPATLPPTIPPTGTQPPETQLPGTQLPGDFAPITQDPVSLPPESLVPGTPPPDTTPPLDLTPVGQNPPSVQNPPIQNLPVQNPSGPSTPGLNTPGLNTPESGIPALDAPPVSSAPQPDHQPVTNAPSLQNPSGIDVPVVESPVAETPVDFPPVTETPVIETPVIETPVGEVPVGETPVGQIPVGQIPVGRSPEVGTPPSQLPVDQAPSPVVESPVGTPAAPAPQPNAPAPQQNPQAGDAVVRGGRDIPSSGDPVNPTVPTGPTGPTHLDGLPPVIDAPTDPFTQPYDSDSDSDSEVEVEVEVESIFDDGRTDVTDATDLGDPADLADPVNPAVDLAAGPAVGTAPPQPVFATPHGYPRDQLDQATPVQRGRVHVAPGWPAPVRSAFEVRRAKQGGDSVVEITVAVDLDPDGRYDDATKQAVMRDAQLAVDEFYNRPDLRLPNGDLLRFRITPKPADGPAHHVVALDPDHEIDQNHWRPGQLAAHTAHEFGHMIGLVEEYSTTPGRLDVTGTVMGRQVEVGPDGKPRPLPNPRVPQRYVDVLALAVGDPAQPAGKITADLPADTPLPRAFTGVPEAAGTKGDRTADVDQPGEHEQEEQDHAHDGQRGETVQDAVTGQAVRDSLPDYLRTSRSLGVAAQKGKLTGAALEVEAHLRKLAPRVKVWKGVEDVAKALADSVAGTLVDGGARAVVKGDGKYYELRMRSTFDWDGLQVEGKGTYTLNAESKDKRRTADESGHKRDANLLPVVQFSGLPGIVVQFVPGVPIAPTEEVGGGTKSELARSSAIAFGSPQEVTAPLTVRFSLFDERARPVRVEGEVREVEAGGEVLLTTSTELATQDDAGALVLATTAPKDRDAGTESDVEALARHGIHPVDRDAPPPRRFVPESVVVNRGAESGGIRPFADQVIALLGPRYAKATSVGAHGRDVVHEFVSEGNIRSNLRRMTVFDGTADPEAGWIRSEPIFKGKNRGGFEWRTRITQLEMRAVARWVRVDGTAPNTSITERRHDHHEHSHRNKLKRRWGLSGFVGGGGDVQPLVTVAGGLTYNTSLERNASSGLEHSTAAKDAVEIKGDAVRYEMVYDIEVRQVGRAGRKPWKLDGNVSSHQWSTQEHARRSGIVPRRPDGEMFRSGPDRTTRGPREFEDGRALLGLVEELDQGELLNRAFQPLLTKLSSEKRWYLDQKKFLRHLENRTANKHRYAHSFTGPDVDNGKLTTKVAKALELGANLGDALSEQEISHLVEHMSDRGSGLFIPLKHGGWVHDHTVTVVLKADVGPVEEGEPLDATEVHGLSKNKDVTTVETGRGREFEIGGGPQGRALGPLGSTDSTVAFGVLLAGVRGSRAWIAEVSSTLTGKRNTERKRGDSLTPDGKVGNRAVRQFRAKVTITGEIDFTERPKKGARKISFGRPGRQAPEVLPLAAPDPVEFELRVLVPEALLGRPGQDEGGDARTPEPTRPVDPALLKPPHALPAPMSRSFDDIEVVAFTAAPELQAAATDVLSAASDHDPVVRSRDQAIARAINTRLSPESLKGDPRLFSRTTIIDSSQLVYERRAEDLVATLGVAFRPKLSARQVTAEEFQEVVREHEASAKVSGSGGTVDQFRGYVVAVPLLTQKGFTGAAGGTNEVAARGVFVIAASPYSVSRGHTAAVHLKGGEKLAVGTPARRMVLARVDIESTVVAEAQHKGNLSFGLVRPDPARTEGAVVDLPESALVWLTEEQFHELRTGEPPQRVEPTATAERGVEPPASLRPGGSAKPSIGLGGIIEPIDLSAQVDALRVKLAANPDVGPELAARLLPDSSLDPKNANIAAVKWFLSDANRMVNSLINGGTSTPVRLEDRFSGRTYDLTLDATFTQAPERGVVGNFTKLKSTVTAEFGVKTVKSRARTLFTWLASARPALTVREEKGPATTDGRAQGQVGGGLGVEKLSGIRDRKKTAEKATKYTQSGALKGPAASHRWKLDLTVGIGRHGRDLASVRVSEDVRITKLAEEAFPEPEHGGLLGSAEPSAPARSAVMTDDDLAAWRAGGDRETTRLPAVEDYWAEHYFGDVERLRSLAKDVLVHSGVPITAQVERAVKAGITPAAVRAGLSAGTEGTFKVPLPGGVDRSLEIHIRLPGKPRFASASAGVDIRSYRMNTEKEEVKITAGGEVELLETAPFGTGGESNSVPPDGSGQPPVRQAFDDKSGSAQRQVTTVTGPQDEQAEHTRTAGPARTFDPLMPWTIAPDDKLSRVLLTGAEFRVVAMPATKPSSGRVAVSYRDLTTHDAYAVRMRDTAATELTGKTLPPELVKATRDLAAKGKAWLAAEQRALAPTAEREARERPIDVAARSRANRLVELDELEEVFAEQQAEVRDLRRRLDTAMKAAAQRGRTRGPAAVRKARADLIVARRAWHAGQTDLGRLDDRRKALVAELSEGGVTIDQLRRYAAALEAERTAVEAERKAEGEWWDAKAVYDREVAALHEQEALERRADRTPDGTPEESPGRSGADRGSADRGGVDRGSADQGGADRGGVDRGSADQGGADRGGVDRGSADQGGADQGSADRGSADQGGADRGGVDRGGADPKRGPSTSRRAPVLPPIPESGDLDDLMSAVQDLPAPGSWADEVAAARRNLGKLSTTAHERLQDEARQLVPPPDGSLFLGTRTPEQIARERLLDEVRAVVADERRRRGPQAAADRARELIARFDLRRTRGLLGKGPLPVEPPDPHTAGESSSAGARREGLPARDETAHHPAPLDPSPPQDDVDNTAPTAEEVEDTDPTPEESAFANITDAVGGLARLDLPEAELRAKLAEYSSLADDDLLEPHELPPGTRARLVALNDSLAAFGDPETAARVRVLVTEALLAASLVPSRALEGPPARAGHGVVLDRLAIQPVAPDRLSRLLDQLHDHLVRGQDPFTAPHSPLRGLDVPADAVLPVRLAHLGLVNLDAEARDAVVHSTLFAALVAHPAALTESMFAGSGHTHRYFPTTSAAAAVDAAVRSTSPTFATLLHLGRAAALATGPRPGSGRVGAAVREFRNLQRLALDLVTRDQALPATRETWRELAGLWSRVVQDLASADSGKPGPDRAALEKHAARYRSQLAPEPGGPPFGASHLSATGPDAVPLAAHLATPEQQERFWHRVDSAGGAVLSTPSGVVHLHATTIAGEPVFVLDDVADRYSTMLDRDRLAAWATDTGARAGAELFPSAVAGPAGEPTLRPADEPARTGADDPPPGDADVLHRARSIPVARFVLDDLDTWFRQDQTALEHTQRVLDVLDGRVAGTRHGLRPAFLARGKPANPAHQEALRLAAVVDNVARAVAESFNDPLLKPLLARRIIAAHREAWGSPEAVEVASALVSDDPLTALLRGDVDDVAAAARVRSVAERAGLDPLTTLDLLRRRHEAEMLSYSFEEIQAGLLHRDEHTRGTFELAHLPGEIALPHYTRVVTVRDPSALLGEVTKSLDLTLTPWAVEKLDALRDLVAPGLPLAPTPPPAPDAPGDPGPRDLAFTADDLTAAGRDLRTPSSVPPPGSPAAAALTQAEYEHLRRIRATPPDPRRRAELVAHLQQMWGLPDPATAEQVLARVEHWFETAPVTISFSADRLFGDEAKAAVLTRDHAEYLPASQVGMRVVNAASLPALDRPTHDLPALRAEAERLEGAYRAALALNPAGVDTAEAHDRFRKARGTLAAAEQVERRRPRQARYLRALLDADPGFAFWTQANTELSRGDNYPRWRRDKDDLIHGRRGLGPRETAVFGAVNLNYHHTRGFEGSQYYGESHLLLTPEIRRRAFYTFGSTARPTAHLSDLMHDMVTQGMREPVDALVRNALGLEGIGPQSFLHLEVHVHGGLRFDRDVRELSLPPGGLADDVRARVERFARHHGIPTTTDRTSPPPGAPITGGTVLAALATADRGSGAWTELLDARRDLAAAFVAQHELYTRLHTGQAGPGDAARVTEVAVRLQAAQARVQRAEAVLGSGAQPGVPRTPSDLSSRHSAGTPSPLASPPIPPPPPSPPGARRSWRARGARLLNHLFGVSPDDGGLAFGPVDSSPETRSTGSDSGSDSDGDGGRRTGVEEFRTSSGVRVFSRPFPAVAGDPAGVSPDDGGLAFGSVDSSPETRSADSDSDSDADSGSDFDGDGGRRTGMEEFRTSSGVRVFSRPFPAVADDPSDHPSDESDVDSGADDGSGREFQRWFGSLTDEGRERFESLHEQASRAQKQLFRDAFPTGPGWRDRLADALDTEEATTTAPAWPEVVALVADRLARLDSNALHDAHLAATRIVADVEQRHGQPLPDGPVTDQVLDLAAHWSATLGEAEALELVDDLLTRTDARYLQGDTPPAPPMAPRPDGEWVARVASARALLSRLPEHRRRMAEETARQLVPTPNGSLFVGSRTPEQLAGERRIDEIRAVVALAHAEGGRAAETARELTRRFGVVRTSGLPAGAPPPRRTDPHGAGESSGGPARRVPPATPDEVADHLALLTSALDPVTGVPTSLLDEHVEDPGLARARSWAAELRDAGVPGVATVFLGGGDPLRFPSPHAFGGTDDQPRGVTSAFRAAVAVEVDPGDGGPPHHLVLDPSVSPGTPLTPDRWAELFGVRSDDGDPSRNRVVVVGAGEPVPPWVREPAPGPLDDPDALVDEVLWRREFRDWHRSLSPAARERFAALNARLTPVRLRLFHDDFRASDDVRRSDLADRLDTGRATTLVPAWPEVVALVDASLADLDPTARRTARTSALRIVNNSEIPHSRDVLGPELVGQLADLVAHWVTTIGEPAARALTENLLLEMDARYSGGTASFGSGLVTAPHRPGAPAPTPIPPPPASVRRLRAAVPPGSRFTDPRRFVGLLGGAGRDVDRLDLAIAFHQTYRGEPRPASTVPPGTGLGRAHLAVEVGHAPEFIGRGPSALVEVADRVRRGGHGTSALVFGSPPYGPDEAWNVVNHHGRVLVVDPRRGTVEPAEGNVRWASDTVHAIALAPDGRPVRGRSPLPEGPHWDGDEAERFARGEPLSPFGSEDGDRPDDLAPSVPGHDPVDDLAGDLGRVAVEDEPEDEQDEEASWAAEVESALDFLDGLPFLRQEMLREEARRLVPAADGAVFIGSRTPEQLAREQRVDQIRAVVAREYAVNGETAAFDLARQLGRWFGTLRTRGVPGGALPGTDPTNPPTAGESSKTGATRSRADVHFQPSRTASGGMSLGVGDGSDDIHWRVTYQSLPSTGDRPFYVFATAKGGKYLVDGSLIDGAALGRLVRDSPHFQAHAADPSVRVRLIGLDPAHRAESEQAARDFAEALRGPGAHREVEVSNGVYDFRRVLLPVRPQDVRWEPLKRADGSAYGVGFATDTRARRTLAKLGSRATDESTRVVAEQPRRADQVTKDQWKVAPWAAATTGNRTRPATLLLESDGDEFVVPLVDGTARSLSVDETARLLLASEQFKRFGEQTVRPPLVVMSHDRYAKPGRGRPISGRLLAKLRELSGPWQGYHYTGGIDVAGGWPFPALPRGHRFTEGDPLPPGHVVRESSGSVFTFPVTDRQPPRGPAPDGPWRPADGSPGPEPLRVVVDSPDGTYARLVTEHDGVRHEHEVDGRGLGRVLLADPVFRAALEADPARPVVLEARHAGERVNFGGLGFDFAGALRAEGFHPDVYASRGPDGTDFALVSVLRAGDLRTEVLKNRDGAPVALYVRAPGDDSRYAAAVRWAANVLAGRADRYAVKDAQGGVAQRESPWDKGTLPLFLIAHSDGDGYLGTRRDGKRERTSPAELARVLRADPVLRDLLGRSGGGAPERSIVLVSPDGTTPGGDEFTRSLLKGGYSRRLHVPPHTVALRPDGVLEVDGGPLVTHDRPRPEPEDVADYPAASDSAGLFGHFYPQDEGEVYIRARSARRTRAVGLRLYLREEFTGGRDARGRPRTRQVPHLAPWLAAGVPPWFIGGHGAPTGISVGLKTDQPLHLGDRVHVNGGDAAKVAAAAASYRNARRSPKAWVVLRECLQNAPAPHGAANAAERFKPRWHRAVEGSDKVFGATAKTINNDESAVLRVLGEGAYREALPDSDDVPSVPLSDLVVTAIPPLALSFPDNGKQVDGARYGEDLAGAARAVVRAAWWRMRNGVPLPEVTITGRGRGSRYPWRAREPGMSRAQAVEAAFRAALAAEAARLATAGVAIDPALIPVRVLGERVPEGATPSATVQFHLTDHELGQAVLADLPEEDVFDEWVEDLYTAFAALEHSPWGNAHPPTDAAVGGLSFNEGGRWDKPRWEPLHASLPPTGDKAFHVFAAARGDRFLVDGELVDGAGLAERVLGSPVFQRLAADPGVPVRLVAFDPANPAASARAAGEFAEALRDAGPPRRVWAATGPLQTDPGTGPGFTLVSRPRPGDPTPSPAPNAPAHRPPAPTGTPPTSPAPNPADDPNPLRSTAASAPWFDPHHPVPSAAVAEARSTTPPTRWVRGEDAGVLDSTTIGPEGIVLRAWRGPIAYDVRDLEIDGTPVRDFTVRLHLDRPDPDLRARALAGVEEVFNRGHRLPGGQQFHVTVEFTDDPADAHARIAVTAPAGRADQLTWPVDTDARRLAHEIGHFLGLRDEYFEPGAVKPIFQHRDGRGRVVHDDTPMTAGLDAPGAALKPRHLRLVDDRMRALESSHEPAPEEFTPEEFTADVPAPAAPKRRAGAADLDEPSADRSKKHRGPAAATDREVEMTDTEVTLVNAGGAHNAAFADLAGGRPLRRITEVDYLDRTRSGIESGEPPSFVVNIIVRASELGDLDRVLDGITAHAGDLGGRVAFVLGVNAPTAADVADAIDRARAVIAARAEPIALVGLPHPPGGFRFGETRNRTLDSDAHVFAVHALAANGTHPYVAVMDFDASDRRTQRGRHVFDHVADLMRAPDDDGPREPLRPLLVGGGYRVSDRAQLRRDTIARINADPNLAPEAKRALVDRVEDDPFVANFELMITEDMHARRNQAAVHPLLPYTPEPNLFFDALVPLADPEVRFGPGGAEFSRLGKALNQFYARELAALHAPPTPDDLAEARERLAADAQNNGHPLRGQAFSVDFVDGATGTDLSRMAYHLLLENSLRQSHVTLKNVPERLFADRKAKDGTKLADERDGLATRDHALTEPFRLPPPGRTDNTWTPTPAMKVNLGNRKKNKLNPAVSTPVPAPFTGLSAGVQEEHKLLAAHGLVASDPYDDALRQMRHLAHELPRLVVDPLTGRNLIAPAGLYAAAGQAAGVDARELRRAAVDRAAAGDEVTRAVARHTLTNPAHRGHLHAALTDTRTRAVRPDDPEAETASATNARDLVGRLIATHLGRTVLIHHGGPRPLALTPLTGEAGGSPVELDLVVRDGRITYRPHRVTP
ncbi:hypothetical protein ACIGNX_01765 [Actinosynnema sp. NPDC053489]|uniref:hypothetical protein n=1 Tax=Actinosynnema sp. NPDC053489 TaxID=3363916 RepID=UPI0037CA2E5A